MSIDFEKLVTTLASPLGLSLIGLIGGLILTRFSRTKPLGPLLIVSSTLLLWASSTPLTSRALVAYWEAPFPPLRVEQYPNVDVVIILGGGMRVGGNMPYPDFLDASDRLVHGFRILKAGKARKVIVSGRGSRNQTASRTEADAMASQLEEWGIPKEDIIIENRSLTTSENATSAADIWRKEGFTSGLLVTSAYHMPRALAVFDKAGINVIAASTDSLLADRDLHFPYRYIPAVVTLEKTTLVWKEAVGFLVYRWRGAL